MAEPPEKFEDWYVGSVSDQGASTNDFGFSGIRNWFGLRQFNELIVIAEKQLGARSVGVGPQEALDLDLHSFGINQLVEARRAILQDHAIKAPWLDKSFDEDVRVEE